MRVLGIDYGKRRMGIAVCDELGITTRGVTTLLRKNLKKDIDEIENLIQSLGVEKVVVGYPLRLNGQPGTLCMEIDDFIVHLQKRLTTIPIVRWDESLSTKDAEEIMERNRVKAKKRKSLVDKIAARLILENYLAASKKTDIS